MMPLDAVRIVKQYEDAKYNPDGSVTKLIKVVFMVGTHGPFTEPFDRDSFTAVARDARLQALARELWIEPAPRA
jgi:hypothetical protein